MRNPLLALDKDELDEGTVHVSDDFVMMDSLQRADLIQDWIDQLEDMYDSITDGDFLKDLAPGIYLNSKLN